MIWRGSESRSADGGGLPQPATTRASTAAQSAERIRSTSWGVRYRMSDHAGVAKPPDLLLCVPQLAEDLGGVLPEERRRGADRGRRPCQSERWRDLVDGTQDGMLHRDAR